MILQQKISHGIDKTDSISHETDNILQFWILIKSIVETFYKASKLYLDKPATC